MRIIADDLEIRAQPTSRAKADEPALQLRSHEACAFVVKVAHVLAYIDGDCDAQRRAALLRLSRTVSLPIEDDGVTRAQQARGRIESATARFLREVQHLADAPLSAYLHAVQWLEMQKGAALREAIGLASRAAPSWKFSRSGGEDFP